MLIFCSSIGAYQQFGKLYYQYIYPRKFKPYAFPKFCCRQIRLQGVTAYRTIIWTYSVVQIDNRTDQLNVKQNSTF